MRIGTESPRPIPRESRLDDQGKAFYVDDAELFSKPLDGFDASAGYDGPRGPFSKLSPKEQAAELAYMAAVQASLSPEQVDRAKVLAGGSFLSSGPVQAAKVHLSEYRHEQGNRFKGLVGQGVVAGTLLASAVDNFIAKQRNKDPRPAGSASTSSGYPSGHMEAASALDGILERLGTRSATNLREEAVVMGQARVASGDHYRSQVAAGWDRGSHIAQSVPGWLVNFASLKND